MSITRNSNFVKYLVIVVRLCYNVAMILYFDTETTGLRPGHIIQLSYIMQDKTGVTAKNFYFKTSHIEASATAVHGITVEALEALSGGMDFYDHFEEIKADFDRADLTVSHNFNFDECFMTAEFANMGYIFRYKEKLDTMRYFTPIAQLPKAYGRGFKHPKLSELASFCDVYPFETVKTVERLFGKDQSSAHDATFDTAAMYLSVINYTEKSPEFKELIEKYL